MICIYCGVSWIWVLVLWRVPVKHSVSFTCFVCLCWSVFLRWMGEWFLQLYHVVGWASVEGRVTKECFCGLTCVASQRERIFLNFHVFWLKETHLFLIVGSFFRVWGVGVGCGNNVHLHLPAHTHTNVMLRTHTSCYAAGHSLALPHTRHTLVLNVLLHFHIHVMLQWNTSACPMPVHSPTKHIKLSQVK